MYVRLHTRALVHARTSACSSYPRARTKTVKGSYPNICLDMNHWQMCKFYDKCLRNYSLIRHILPCFTDIYIKHICPSSLLLNRNWSSFPVQSGQGVKLDTQLRLERTLRVTLYNCLPNFFHAMARHKFIFHILTLILSTVYIDTTARLRKHLKSKTLANRRSSLTRCPISKSEQ